MKSFFDRVVCINLSRRRERWLGFLDRIGKIDWPFRDVERFDAIDGESCPPPAWWSHTPGAWGCYRSHVRVLEEALVDGVERLLVLEDDAAFDPDFPAKVEAFLRALPADWDQIYLGGKRLAGWSAAEVNREVLEPEAVLTTHSYGVQRAFAKTLYAHLHSFPRGPRNPFPGTPRGLAWALLHTSFRPSRALEKHCPVDQQMAALHLRSEHRIYCPHDWLTSPIPLGSDTARYGVHRPPPRRVRLRGRLKGIVERRLHLER